MNKVILLFDDREERFSTFRDLAKEIGYSLKVIRDIKAAKNTFLSVDPEIVFLEAKLNRAGKINNENINIGAEFAKWIGNNDKNIKDRSIIVHAINHEEAKAIKNELRKCVIIPYNLFARDRNVLFKSGALTLP